MNQQKVLELALEALSPDPYKSEWVVQQDISKAITAIKEALAQPEQEPVTWRYKIVDVFGRPAWTLKTPKSDTRVLESQPLYTTPPQRTWVGLTNEERADCWETIPELAMQKVEAKLKKKNT